MRSILLLNFLLHGRKRELKREKKGEQHGPIHAFFIRVVSGGEGKEGKVGRGGKN